jgi:hypothetical protein
MDPDLGIVSSIRDELQHGKWQVQLITEEEILVSTDKACCHHVGNS